MASGCRGIDANGSGLMIAPGLVLTAAHVVAGATSIEVRRPARSTSGTVVAFDPEMDLAVLATDDADLARQIPLAEPDVVGSEAHGLAVVFRDGAPTLLTVELRRRVEIRTEDIYLEGETSRPGWELTGDIRRGDSGGAVIVDGRAVGVLWARSRRVDARAYAIDPVRGGGTIRAQLASGAISEEIDLTRCR